MKQQQAALRRILAASALAMGLASAHGQGVTVYGKVDVGVSKKNAGTSPFGGGGGAANSWSVLSGADSILGFRGEEDLGDGYTARFRIEQRFSADTGTFRTTGTAQSPVPAWWGESTVSLDGPLGGITLGRQNFATAPMVLFADPFRWDTVGGIPALLLPNGFGVNDVLKYNNGVMLRTARYKGFAAQVGVGLGEGNVRGRSEGISVTYVDGPLWIGLGRDQRISATRDIYDIVTAMYDFGRVKPIVSYARSEVAGVGKSVWSLGAIAPLGTAELKGVFAVGHPRIASGQAPETKKIGLGLHYWLSKRTKIYTDLGSSKSEGLTRSTAYDFGLQHNF